MKKSRVALLVAAIVALSLTMPAFGAPSLTSLGKRVAVHAEGDLPTNAVADVFPAYDDDGGLLLILTPE